MKMLLSTTALALAMGLPSMALAQPASQAAERATQAQSTELTRLLNARDNSDILASELMGRDVHARAAAEVSASAAADSGRTMAMLNQADLDGLESIGKVKDIVLTHDGQILALVIGVGGFLGIGEKDVAVTMDQVTFGYDRTDLSQMHIVVDASADTVADWPRFERSLLTESTAATQARAAQAARTTEAARVSTAARTAEAARTTETARAAEAARATEAARTTEAARAREAARAAETARTTEAARVREAARTTEAARTAEAASAAEEARESETARASQSVRTSFTRPNVTRDGYNRIAVTDVTTVLLTGKTVYDVNDRSVGTVDDLILNEDGVVTNVIIDFGGFLGIGTRQVSLDYDELTVLWNDSNETVRVYVDATRAAIQARPQFVAEAAD
ncbi:MAG: PRC-barrel domain-containing protein [Oceanicaulis sp.]|nr:PRC-barrel domain-containing protein [Oceanicaulis sp.]